MSKTPLRPVTSQQIAHLSDRQFNPCNQSVQVETSKHQNNSFTPIDSSPSKSKSRGSLNPIKSKCSPLKKKKTFLPSSATDLRLSSLQLPTNRLQGSATRQELPFQQMNQTTERPSKGIRRSRNQRQEASRSSQPESFRSSMTNLKKLIAPTLDEVLALKDANATLINFMQRKFSPKKEKWKGADYRKD